MLVKVDFKYKGKTESLIFGHHKGGNDWKARLALFLNQAFVVNLPKQEAKRVWPEILKIEQADGSTSKNFLWCRPSAWTRHTKETYPRFGEATSRTENGVRKQFEDLKKGKLSTSKKAKSSKTTKATSSAKPKGGSASKKSDVQEG